MKKQNISKEKKQETPIVYEIIDYTLNKEYAQKMRAEGFIINEV